MIPQTRLFGGDTSRSPLAWLLAIECHVLDIGMVDGWDLMTAATTEQVG
jgi:hypothetical protein